ncbi:MAG: nucleoside deaminase [Anaerolineae bacterium]
MHPRLHLQLPDWIAEEIGDPQRPFTTVEDRMALAIRLAARNVELGGGPFGAAVFEIDSGRLVAPGVNLVLPLNSSLAHAEAIAIMAAEQALGTHDLGAEGLPPMELVTSAQPCIQCYGITWWSGVQRLVIGATKEDVETITGFVEGPLPNDWVDQLGHRDPLQPVTVIQDVLGDEARAVLRRYREISGAVYNPGGAVL